MDRSITQLFSVPGEGEAKNVSGDHDTVDSVAKANQQRRKVQNRNNQRAHRLRMKEKDSESVQNPQPFEVRRWRIDEHEDCTSQNASVSRGASSQHIPPHTHVSTSVFAPIRAVVLRGPPPNASIHAQTTLTPPSIVFPLSTDHLLHLVQYNVFRAFVSNKRTLNTLLTGWTDAPHSPTTCPLSGPYRDDTSVYPLNPNIPPSLFPTHLQQTRLHSLWINLFPFPCLRDNLIRREGSFDFLELLQDLIGLLFGAVSAQKRPDIPQTIIVSDPTSMRTAPPAAEQDEDEITAGRKGLIIWGEPHDMWNWEATPGFLAKWSWVADGCCDIVESSNRWRRRRGEEPLRFPESKR